MILRGRLWFWLLRKQEEVSTHRFGLVNGTNHQPNLLNTYRQYFHFIILLSIGSFKIAFHCTRAGMSVIDENFRKRLIK